jgi:hypothetical protein
LRKDGRRQPFVLDDHSDLVSHYKDQTLYDSLVEETLAKRFEESKTEWTLEHESEIVNLKETVMFPDFTFRHPDGRTALLEIMGRWRPEYLKRKPEKRHRAQRRDLTVAVSTNLDVSEDDCKDVPGGVFFLETKSGPKMSYADWTRSRHPHPDRKPDASAHRTGRHSKYHQEGPGLKRSPTNRKASSRVESPPSNCASSTAISISLKRGPGA